MREFLTEERFKQLAKDGVVDGKGLRKQVVDEIEKGGGSSERSLTFTISTASVDRQSDTVSLDGWNFDNYLKNPVVLWAHDYSRLPIARATKVWKYGSKIKAAADFVPAEMPEVGPFAEAVYQMYKGGFLNATSVGFLPTKWSWSEDEGRKYGIDFSEQELLEFSAVPVPANPEALLEAKSAGIDVEPLRDWAKSILGSVESRVYTISEMVDAKAIAEQVSMNLKLALSVEIPSVPSVNHATRRRELEVLRLR